MIFYFDLKSLFGSVILILIGNHFCLWSFPTLDTTDETGRLVCDAFCSRQCSRLAQSYRIKCQTKSLTCTEQTLERVSDGPWRETLLPLSTRCYEGVYHSHCRLGIEWSANLLKALKTRWISRVVDSAGYPSAFYCTLNTHYRIVSYRIVAETRFYAVFIHSVAFNVLV